MYYTLNNNEMGDDWDLNKINQKVQSHSVMFVTCFSSKDQFTRKIFTACKSNIDQFMNIDGITFLYVS